MPIVYTDNAIKSAEHKTHPACIIRTDHPCYRMVREAIDGKSVFHFTEGQAMSMAMWYLEGWKDVDIVDEFGSVVYESDFKKSLKASHYMIGKKVSPNTIEELWAAKEMEKKILEATENEEA